MFSERLNATRHARGLTAQQMASQLQIGLRSYRNYESGDREPSLTMLVRIADILGVTTDYLLCRGEAPADEPQTNPPARPTSR